MMSNQSNESSDHFLTTLRNLPSLVVLSACAWLLIIWIGVPG